MCNRKCASIVHQMPTNVYDYNEHKNMQFAQQNPPTSVAKGRKKPRKMEGFVEQMVCNSSSLIAYFYATTTLLKNTDVHITTLI